MGLSIDNKEYFYIKDILENIMGIIDQEGNVIVYYKYDAWGNLLEEDIKNFNINNTSEQVVYNSHYFSYYKGSVVINHSFVDSSFAINRTIFLYTNHKNDRSLKHEYGHLLQERELGTLYYVRIVIPSMLNSYKNTPGNESVYYSQPWEYDADIRGGVVRNFHTPSSTIEADNYVTKPYNPSEWKEIYKHFKNYLKSEMNWLYNLFF